MKKIFIFVALLGLGACTSTNTYKVSWVSGSLQQVLEMAQEQNKPVLVDFYSDT